MKKLKISEDDVKPDEVNIDDQLHLLSEIESDSGGSDSSVSDGLPMQLLHASVPEVRNFQRKLFVLSLIFKFIIKLLFPNRQHKVGTITDNQKKENDVFRACDEKKQRRKFIADKKSGRKKEPEGDNRWLI